MALVDTRQAIQDALMLFREHPGIHVVEKPWIDQASGAFTVDTLFTVNLPSEWRRQGESPSGVRLQEEVRFEFPREFPLVAPSLSLRQDFGRNFPHVQPWLSNGRPVPCIHESDLSDLLHQQRLVGILDQTCEWLERAALGTLIDPDQGWEPVLRDSLGSTVVADARYLQGLVDSRGGCCFLEIEYVRIVAKEAVECFCAQASNREVQVDSKLLEQSFFERELDREHRLIGGKSVALIVWPGKLSSGKPFVCGEYLPETVSDFAGLKWRAELYGCSKQLNEGLRLLRRRLVERSLKQSLRLVVILLVRRPFKLIGSESPIELCPYVVEICAPNFYPDDRSSRVRPAGHRHVISRSLLTNMTGLEESDTRRRWTLLGAGSLGSKLALHLARAGSGPRTVIDQSAMSPHNAARHALIPAGGDGGLQLGWMDNKARLLSQALCGFDQPAKPITADAVCAATSGKYGRDVWAGQTWAVVNATASLAVREALGASKKVTAPVVETSLFAGGRIGMVTTEGPNRNPSTTGLMAESHALLRDHDDLASVVFGAKDSVSRRITGHGCGSLTMAMTDGRLSLFAAGMAEYLLKRMRDGLPERSGEILIGQLLEDGMSVEWRHWCVPAATVVQTKPGNDTWSVRIHGRALAKIQKEVACWPKVETGGVLVGRLSEPARVAHVVDVVEAPKDSVRSSTGFILGKHGLRQRLQTYSQQVDGTLYCLGTWHSHLSPGGPSACDWATAKAVSLSRSTPSFFLIYTPNEPHAFMMKP